MENYRGEELQKIIDEVIDIVPDIAKTDINVAPILEAVRALTAIRRDTERRHSSDSKKCGTSQ